MRDFDLAAGKRILAIVDIKDQDKKVIVPAGTPGTVVSLFEDGRVTCWEEAGVTWECLPDDICAVHPDEVILAKPARVDMMGAFIMVVDPETGKDVKGFNFPATARNGPNPFTFRVIREMAKLGYEVRKCPSMAGEGQFSILIGG